MFKPLKIFKIMFFIIFAGLAFADSIKKDVIVNLPVLSSTFTKNNNNFGIISLRIDRKFPEYQAKVLGNKLELIFNHFKINATSQKNYDVSDFGTIVQSFRIIKLGDSVKVEIFNKERFSYRIENKANNFRIFLNNDFNKGFNNLSKNALNNKKNYKGNNISLDFQDISIRTLLQIIAKESGYNIIVSDNVQGNMTLSLNNVPWEQALDLILRTKNLDQRREGNIIRISNRSEFINQDKQILNSQREINEIGILQSKIFYLKYRNALDIQAMIKNSTGVSGNDRSSILSPRGSIMVDNLSNTIVVTDNKIVLDKIDTLINQLDVPAKQVMIEARIVEANEDFVRNFGLRYGMNKDLSDRSSIFGSENIGNADVKRTTSSGERSYNIPININLPAAAASSAISVIKQTASSLIFLELTAMQTEGKGKIISSPKVLTQDRKRAFLEEGEDFPYQQATGIGNTNVAFKKAVTGLSVTPNITPDGNIIMDLQINKDSIKDRENGAMNVKRLETKAMVENGGTIVVGGIFVEEDLHGIEKVPLLGDIPVIGNLFKKRSKSRNRRELLIFITPKIVDHDFAAISY